jgi:hypothetical protein
VVKSEEEEEEDHIEEIFGQLWAIPTLIHLGFHTMEGTYSGSGVTWRGSATSTPRIASQ